MVRLNILLVFVLISIPLVSASILIPVYGGVMQTAGGMVFAAPAFVNNNDPPSGAVISFCPGIGYVDFRPDVRFFNFTTRTITQYNISAVNQTSCLYNATSNNPTDWIIYTNQTTTSKQRIYCGTSLATKFEVFSTPQQYANSTTNATVSCWMDLISAGRTDYTNIGIIVAEA